MIEIQKLMLLYVRKHVCNQTISVVCHQCMNRLEKNDNSIELLSEEEENCFHSLSLARLS
jgi:hypothetical protein